MPSPSPQNASIRYRLTERLMAAGGDYYIQSDSGERLFKIDGKAIRESDTVSIQDLQGIVVCRFRPLLETVNDAVVVSDGMGTWLATVRRQQITPLRDRFTIELSGEQLLEIQGKVAVHEYEVNDASGVVATVSTRWFRARDSYGVEIAPGQFDACILAAVVALDQMVGASPRHVTG